MSEQLVKASATWMAQAVHHRDVSAVELFDAHAARIAERDPKLNAFTDPTRERALTAAVGATRSIRWWRLPAPDTSSQSRTWPDSRSRIGTP